MSKMKFCLLGAVLLLTVTVASCGNVSYDGRSLIIDGQRKLLISASIHYPRSVPAVTLHPFFISSMWDFTVLWQVLCLWQMWPGLVQTAKEGGVDVIETYVFWNGHELSPGNVSNMKSFLMQGMVYLWLNLLVSICIRKLRC